LLALSDLLEFVFGMIKQGQYPIRNIEQMSTSLCEPQTPPLAKPNGRAKIIFQLSDGMAEGRLGHAEHSGSGRQRTVLLDSVHDPKVDTFNHIIDEQN
jgi:hypothetical protein